MVYGESKATFPLFTLDLTIDDNFEKLLFFQWEDLREVVNKFVSKWRIENHSNLLLQKLDSMLVS